ncbi:hypothetical protein PpBr36_03977 [Pyricularia pennisetigena]|uniref:hypothetical protein n=1 Tax=Pyricularia pennisetigena TaxID=1578925 RepID=UPI001153F34F|nr:hypothetical protein PpBr36_03977 [Pyricularia pennisetigena]TLS26922.1 hypothetical protein PpBr36_03977 [Pyricularia pennisetigena]
MRVSQIVAMFGLVAVGVAQQLPPSPTASVDCEPHGDHWHCRGPRTTVPGQSVTANPSGVTTRPPAAASATATSSRHHDHDHDDDDDDDHDDDHDDDDHHSGTRTLPPSPTASVGCQPHGDHWHCTGPKTGSAATVASTATGTGAAAGTTTPRPSGSAASSTPTPAGAARAGFNAVALAAAGAVLIL